MAAAAPARFHLMTEAELRQWVDANPTRVTGPVVAGRERCGREQKVFSKTNFSPWGSSPRRRQCWTVARIPPY